MILESSFQSEAEWLLWRRGGIGSSDAPIVMGVSEFMTPRELWEVKLGLREHNQSNPAIEKGKYWEPKVRARYELDTAMDFMPRNVEAGFLRASLDGYNEETRTILEIKVPGKEVFEAAKSGVVHEKYVYQLEHQLFVTGADVAHFVCAKTSGKSVTDGRLTEYVVVKYKSDQARRESLLSKVHEFWGFVESKTPPPMTDRDVLQRDDLDSINLSNRYVELKSRQDVFEKQARALDDEIGEVKKKLIEGSKHKRERIGRVSLTRVEQRTLDQEKLTQAVGDLFQFQQVRSYYRISIDDEA
jgi:putative phage-type endonuclease